jgi:hypothetical protein
MLQLFGILQIAKAVIRLGDDEQAFPDVPRVYSAPTQALLNLISNPEALSEQDIVDVLTEVMEQNIDVDYSVLKPLYDRMDVLQQERSGERNYIQETMEDPELKLFEGSHIDFLLPDEDYMVEVTKIPEGIMVRTFTFSKSFSEPKIYTTWEEANADLPSNAQMFDIDRTIKTENIQRNRKI